MKIYEDDDPLVLNGTYDTEGYKPGERARIAKAKARMAQIDQQQQERTPMPTHKLFDVGKVGLWLDTIAHSTEKRKDTDTKVVVLTLRVQPFDVQLATALHPNARATLFAGGSGANAQPFGHIARVNFELAVPRQNLDIFATDETVKATMRLEHVKIAGVYARTENGVGGYACVFKATFGPVSDKELGFVEAWRNGLKFVTFEESEPNADFDEPDEDDDDDDGGDEDQGQLLPPPEFDTEPSGAPLGASAGRKPARAPGRRTPGKRGRRG